ncbi:hypothetical protein [Allohahella sp. A8]|uniref:hypothetical protein n=1 Tax=Allohahella sp. A8 TaxID=3141461 RepID=UPI003A80114D
MNRFKSLIALVMPLITAYAAATEVGDVSIVSLDVNRSLQQVFVLTSSTHKPQMDCHKDIWWHFTFSIKTEADKAVFSTLLAAQSAGKKVFISGKSDCQPDGYNRVEELLHVTIKN